MLLCGLKGAANQAQANKQNHEAVGQFIESAFAYFVFLFQGYKQFKYDNSHSFGLSCAGLDILGPRIKFEGGKVVVDIKIDKEPVHKLESSSFCDDLKGEGWLVHPQYLKESLPPSWWAEVEQRVMRVQGDARYHYLSDPLLKKWLDWGNKSFKHVVSPIISMLSNHYYLVDFCKSQWPNRDPSRCAVTLDYYKAHNFYDRQLEERDFRKVKKKFTTREIDVQFDDL